jgi:hypothetical protein
MNQRDWTADAIKLAAVATATPRWVAALLLAEGFTVPPEWLWWWVPLAALLNAGMAITEGLAFAYIFAAWKRANGRQAGALFALACLSAVSFVGILAPYVAGAAVGATLAHMLGEAWAAWLWGVCVASSTMVIVAGVGYAQKHGDSTAQDELAQAHNDLASLQARLDSAEQQAQAAAAWDLLNATQQARLVALACDNGERPEQGALAEAIGVSTSTVSRGYAQAEAAL